jgi:hypothetical protein
LQVNVSSVHVRFEDTSAFGDTFALGITLDKLAVQSTDGDWNIKFIDPTVDPIMHKLLSLNAFSVYLDTSSNVPKLADLRDSQHVRAAMLAMIPRASLNVVVAPPAAASTSATASSSQVTTSSSRKPTATTSTSTATTATTTTTSSKQTPPTPTKSGSLPVVVASPTQQQQQQQQHNPIVDSFHEFIIRPMVRKR